MNKALKQFSAELLKDFQSALLKNHSVVSEIKATEDGGAFKVIISTSDEDRQGDMIDQSKWKLENYEKNPVVLWAHDYSTPPIGICTKLSVENGKLVAEGKFAPSALNSFAGEISGLYEAGYINTTSVGYIQHEDGELELLEFSFVPVPANPFALSIRETKNLKLNMAELVMKGLSFTTKGAVPYKSHGIVEDTDAEWNGPAQVKACGDDLDKLKSICTWFDGENADKKSAYKLPHHEASSLKANWRGVAAAMGALMGSRGGVDIPEADKKAVFSHLSKHYKEFGKEAPDYEKAIELFDILKKSPELINPMNKSPQIGDHCELDDGTPGVLADDPKNPGEMICVPERDKSQKTETDMNNELIKKLKAEHERHGKEVAKAIDEFETKAMADEEGAEEGKAHKEEDDNSEHEKSIEEFKDAIDDEQGEHLKKCMKAIDDSYETMGREPNKDEKAINEFKSEMKAEHLKHVKAFHKAIDEFKSDHDEADGKDEREEAFAKCEKAMAVELDRHEKAHMKMCKAESETMGEGEDDGKSEDEKALAEFVAKAGRAISAKNKEKLKAILEKMEAHHNDVTAAIKELMGSEEGDEGKEPSKKPGDESDDEKALKQGRAPQGATAELETYLFTQRIVRQINTAAEGALRQIKEKIKDARQGS